MKDKNKSYILLTGLYGENELDKIIEYSINNNIDIAAYQLQRKLIEGIKNNINPNDDLYVISKRFLGYYPKMYRKHRIKKQIELKNNIKYEYIGFINLLIIRNIITNIKIIINILKRMKSNRNNDRYLIIYSTSFLFIPFFIKLLISNIKICLYITDLPTYNDYNNKNNIIIRYRNIIRTILLNICISKVDLLIGVSDLMVNKLTKNKKIKSIVIEGMTDRLDEEVTRVQKENIITYAGRINYEYGIKELIEAVKILNNENVESKLMLCGYGNAIDYVKRAAKEVENIHYLGNLNQAQLKILLEKSKVLINPRNKKQGFTKYSFPSKILEYLSFGNIIIGYKLDGMPKIYDEYIIIPKGNTIKELADAIKDALKICEEDVEKIRERNVKFSITKNYNNQTKTLLSELNKI